MSVKSQAQIFMMFFLCAKRESMGQSLPNRVGCFANEDFNAEHRNGQFLTCHIQNEFDEYLTSRKLTCYLKSC